MVELLVICQRLSWFSTQLDVQVVGDVVPRNTAGRFSCVIADLSIRGELKELWEEAEGTRFELCVTKLVRGLICISFGNRDVSVRASLYAFVSR